MSQDKHKASRVESRLLSMIYEGRGMYPGCAIAIDAIAAKVKAIFAEAKELPPELQMAAGNHSIGVFKDGKLIAADEQVYAPSAIGDMVPRSRYDACNADWLREKVRAETLNKALARLISSIEKNAPPLLAITIANGAKE